VGAGQGQRYQVPGQGFNNLQRGPYQQNRYQQRDNRYQPGGPRQYQQSGQGRPMQGTGGQRYNNRPYNPSMPRVPQHYVNPAGGAPQNPALPGLDNIPQTGTSAQQAERFKTLADIHNHQEEFLKADDNTKKLALGNLIFKKVVEQLKNQGQNQEQAPKITGMLIDFTVFEIRDILDMLESEQELQERIQEALNLLQTNTQ